MTTTTIIFFIVGLIIGGIVAWLIASSRARGAEAVNNELRQQIQQRDSEITQIRDELNTEQQEKVKALTELNASLKNLEEQKTLFETMKTEMTNTFNTLSAEALRISRQDFINLASERLDNIMTDTKGKLGEHKTAIDGLIKPLHEALKRYEEQIKDIEENRHKAYGSLEEQLRSLALTHEQLQRETGNLVTALKRPQVRGRWGEITLRRVAELSGMSVHCDFTEQQSLDTEKGRLRPDMIVHLPMDREIVVDAKVSLDAYLDAVSTGTEDEKRIKLKKHAEQVRAHMNRLASKEYWAQFVQSPEFVVLFLPGESFFSVALEVDHTLIEDGIQKRVIIATPITLIALLRAIAYGWRQEQVTKNAQEISELGRQLYERINILVQHFGNIGSALEKAIGAYNKAIGSMELRVLPSVRKFKELGVTSADEIPILEQIDQMPRNTDLIKADTNED